MYNNKSQKFYQWATMMKNQRELDFIGHLYKQIERVSLIVLYLLY